MQPASTYFQPGTADRLLELLVRHTCPLSLCVPLFLLRPLSVSIATLSAEYAFELRPCVSSLQLGLLGAPQQAEALAAEAARL